MKPSRLGNINNESLKDLINCDTIINFRHDSLNGELDCYDGCNLVRYEKYPVSPLSPIVNYSDMNYLHMNFGEKCNIACTMCKVHIRSRENKSILDPMKLKENIDLGPFNEIVIQGGEPLFIPECLDYLNFLGQQGKKYVLLTNGLLIDDDMANQLARDADRVCISINASSKATHEFVNRGSDYDMVLDNIQKLINARDNFDSDLVLHGRMTLTTSALHEIPLFIQSYEDIGFDRINFGYDRATVPQYLDANPDFKNSLSSEILQVMNHAKLGDIDYFRLVQLGLITESDINQLRGD